MELLKMNTKELLNLMREEINIINTCKTSVTEEVEHYDYDLKEVIKETVLSKDLIVNNKNNIVNLNNEQIKTSKIYMFKLNKIQSYNDLIDFWIVNNKKIVKHNEKYENYKSEITNLFKVNDIDGKLTNILQEKNIKLTVEFYVNYSQKDIDNISKPFIDCLFYNVSKSDNQIKEINSKILKSENKNEYILFKIESIKKIDLEYSEMLKEYFNQL